MSLDASRAVLARITLHADRTRAAASGLLLATDVADYLVARGVPFRDAHGIVGAMVRQLLAERRDFSALSLEEWRAFSPHFGDDVRAAVTADASVASRKTPQSTAPSAVREALAQTRRWLLHYRDLSS